MWASLSTLRGSLKTFGRRHRKIIFFIAFSVFILGLFVTGKALKLNPNDLVFKPLLLAIFLTQPLLIFLNSLEFKLCGHAVDVDVNIRDAVYVSCSASLANILPLPAGLLVRGGSLVQRSGDLGFVSKVLLVAGTMWMAVAMTVSGAVISEVFTSRIVTITGAGLLIALMAYITRISHFRIAFGFLVIRALMVAVLALQLKLCFAALGEIITLRGSAVYVVSGIAGAVVSIVPAGLGLTEAFGALLAKIDGASAALAYIVLSLNRLIGFSMAGVAFFLFAKVKSEFAVTRT